MTFERNVGVTGGVFTKRELPVDHQGQPVDQRLGRRQRLQRPSTPHGQSQVYGNFSYTGNSAGLYIGGNSGNEALLVKKNFNHSLNTNALWLEDGRSRSSATRTSRNHRNNSRTNEGPGNRPFSFRAANEHLRHTREPPISDTSVMASGLAVGGDVEKALESVGVPSYVLDETGYVRWLNPAAERGIRRYGRVCAN